MMNLGAAMTLSNVNDPPRLFTRALHAKTASKNSPLTSNRIITSFVRYASLLRYWCLLFILCAAGLAQKDDSDIYVVGGDVKPPKVIHYVEPESSSSSQDAYVEGVVRISTVVNLDGLPSDLHVTKGLNSEEDRLAVEALKQWRFQPGTRKGQPVRVRINVEIEFHLL